MANDEDQLDVYAKWMAKIDAKRRVKAVCKPCWEIKYCPYGPLVEQFPLADEDDDRCCRIFGHQCPVFHVAEPFTETKVLRNISRTTSRPTRIRVLNRENQVCRDCGKSVAADDIHFDHIIPWSKGGPSDEHNIQLLCSNCNLRKSDKFERKHLVSSVSDHFVDPVDHDILEYLDLLMDFAHEFREEEGRFPDADDIAACMNDGKRDAFEEQSVTVIEDLKSFFSGKRPKELGAKIFKALRDRWGFADGTMYSVRSIVEYYEVDETEFLDAEISLVGRLGWPVHLNTKSKAKWLSS